MVTGSLMGALLFSEDIRIARGIEFQVFVQKRDASFGPARQRLVYQPAQAFFALKALIIQ